MELIIIQDKGLHEVWIKEEPYEALLSSHSTFESADAYVERVSKVINRVGGQLS